MTDATAVFSGIDETAATAAAPPPDAAFVTLNALPGPFNQLEPEDGFERIVLRPDVGHADYVVSYDAATQELALRNLTHGLVESVAIGSAGPIASGETRDVTFDQIGAVITLNAAFDFEATLEDFIQRPLIEDFIVAFDIVSVEGDLSGASDEIVFEAGDSISDVTAVCGAFSASGLDFSYKNRPVFEETEDHVFRLTDGVNAFTVSMTVQTEYLDYLPDPIGLAKLGQSFVSAPEGPFDIQAGLASTLIGSEFDDVLHGSAARDDFVTGDGDDAVFGGDGNDRIFSGAGENRLFGDAGDDEIRALHGVNHIDGGSGTDRYIASRLTDVDVIVRLDHGTLSSAVGSGTIVNVEHVTTSRGDDIVIGDAADNKLRTGDGADVVAGGAGDDRLNGEFHDDRLFGGPGADTLFGESGNDRLVGDDGDDLLSGGRDQDVLLGKSGDDRLFGGEGDDRLFGDDGDDDIEGREDADFLRGGDGADTLDGGDGDDRAFGDDGDDSIGGGDGEDRLLGGSGDDDIAGGNDADRLYGGDGRDLMFGQDGDDHIRGDAGDDVVNGGVGDDVLLGGNDDDQLSGARGDDNLLGENGDDHLYGGDGDDRLYGGDGRDAISGQSGDDLIWGGAGGDVISGGDGDDVLLGGDGDDVIAAAAGTDRLRGGAGADVFRYLNNSDLDVILDFEDGVDRISFVSHSSVDGAADLVISGVNGGLDTKITLAADPTGSNMIILRGVAATDVDASDFQF